MSRDRFPGIKPLFAPPMSLKEIAIVDPSVYLVGRDGNRIAIGYAAGASSRCAIVCTAGVGRSTESRHVVQLTGECAVH